MKSLETHSRELQWHQPNLLAMNQKALAVYTYSIMMVMVRLPAQCDSHRSATPAKCGL